MRTCGTYEISRVKIRGKNSTVKVTYKEKV